MCFKPPTNMSTISEYFITKLKKQVPKNISLTEEVAAILGINYDAAYRRLKNKVAFTIEETILLAKKFDISLNELYEIGESNSYLVKETSSIKQLHDFTIYFENLHQELKFLVGRPDASILFSARELPMFYFFNNPLLLRFKIFIWFAILKVTHVNKNIKFSDFTILDKLIQNAQKVAEAYTTINLTEMWSYGAINNVLQQLLYFYRMKQIDLASVQEICIALKNELKKIEYRTLNGENNQTTSYHLYSNDLLMMNNSMIVKNKDKLTFGYPYALLKFFTINNQKACKEQELYIREQMHHATCITNTSIKEHRAFFNHKYAKIDQVLAVIKNEESKPLFL